MHATTNLQQSPGGWSVRSHGEDISQRSCTYRIYSSTEGSIALLAISASPICDIEWHHNSITFLEKHDASASFNNDSHILMAENQSRSSFGSRTAFVPCHKFSVNPIDIMIVTPTCEDRLSIPVSYILLLCSSRMNFRTHCHRYKML